MAKNCRWLTHLKIGDCKRVTDVGVEAIAMHCPSLQHLEVYNCEGVTDEGPAD